ncbi:hypothetical protein GALL_224900 [mine drainage metagenome]|uniref:Transposase IS701-like DDE domain-containing protein n=1 Tax=mine drainage metagenome TaxID=410659 RepID=A0A1J5RIB5_9ZZZZ
MSASQRFEEYLEHSGDGLGHMDRHTGPMTPRSHNSIARVALLPNYCLLADAGCRVNQEAFRSRFTDMGLPYAVGIKSSAVVWPPGVEPLLPKRSSGMGRSPVMPRRTRPVSLYRSNRWLVRCRLALSRRSVGAKGQTKCSEVALRLFGCAKPVENCSKLDPNLRCQATFLV